MTRARACPVPLRPLPVTSALSFLPLGEMAPFPGLHLTRSPGAGSPAGLAHSALCRQEAAGTQVGAAKTEGHCSPADPELLATAACSGSVVREG